MFPAESHEFRLGWIAFEHGETSKDNPYDKDSEQYTRWLRGNLYAIKHYHGIVRNTDVDD